VTDDRQELLTDYQPCEQYVTPLDGSDFCTECGCEEADHG
jgi:hypothetical protein